LTKLIGEEKMKNENDLEKYLVGGLLAGGIIGILVGLLYAPKSGQQFRKDIKYKSENYIDDIEDYVTNSKRNANKLIKKSKKKSKALFTDAIHKINSLVSEAEQIIDDTKQKTKNLIERKS
jgi:gas vesicle protein